MDSLQTWYRDTTCVHWQDHRITLRSQGLPAATATVLIHGFPTASWDWHRIWPAVCQLGPALAFDMLGFGYSAKPHPYPYSLMGQADLALDLCRQLKIERIHLLAHDYGDTVAQELLARAADSPAVVSCYLLNGGIIPGQHRPLPVQRLLSGPAGPLVARLMSRGRFGRNFSRIFGPGSQPGEQDLDHCWQLIEHHGGRRVIAALSRYRFERRQHSQRWVQALAKAQQPVGALIGERDPISGGHMADALEHLCPNVQAQRLAQIGHYPQLEAPQEVMNRYAAFRQQAPA